VNEPKAVYKEMFPGEWNRLDSNTKFGSIDADEDGSITFVEVLEFKNITDTTGVAYNWATRQFGRADSDNDGYVTPVEMQDYLQTEERE
jgi:Ca2+-binding EF-hand superfamily protein